jgi:hypothetical protein
MYVRFHIDVQVCSTISDGLLIIYVQTNTLDEASRKRDERNRQQRKRRAEMTTEQRDEANRKQREYRARKKVTTQNITTSCECFKTSLFYFHLQQL